MMGRAQVFHGIASCVAHLYNISLGNRNSQRILQFLWQMQKKKIEIFIP